MSLGTLSLFLGSTFITQTYPILRESLGIGITFILYGLALLPAALIVKKLVPETKGKSLEDIERYWEEKSKNGNRDSAVPYKQTETNSPKSF